MALIPLSFGLGGGGGSDEVTATKNQVLAGYTAITSDSNDEPIEGTIPSQPAQIIYPSTSDIVIPSGKYLSGNQTIKAVSQNNLAAGNIRKNVAVKINNGSIDLFSATGSYSTPSGSQNPVTADKMLSGYSAFVNGGPEVQGNIQTQAGKTVYATTSDQTAVAGGKYCGGNIVLKGLTQSNLASANIMRGKTISVNNGSANVFSQSGSSNVLKCVSGSASQAIGSSTTNITVPGLSAILFFIARVESQTWQEQAGTRYYYSGCFGNTNILSSHNDYGMYVQSITPSSSSIQYITSRPINGSVITVYHYLLTSNLPSKSGTIYYYAFGY
jgi:hypothetical protein